METDYLHSKNVLTARIRECQEDYDTVLEDMEDHSGLTAVQWASVHLLCDMYAALRMAKIDAERAGFEPDCLL